MALLGSTSLTGCNSIPDFIAAGSLMLFQQTSAPTSWTKQTTHNNKALRVVNGTAAPGGSTAFTTVFTSRSVQGSVGQQSGGGTIGDTAAGGSVGQQSGGGTIGDTAAGGSVGQQAGGGTIGNTAAGGSVGNHTLQQSQIASHTHQINIYPTGPGADPVGPSIEANNIGGPASTVNTASRGGDGAHNHPFSGDQHNHPFTGAQHNHPFSGSPHNHPFTGAQHNHPFSGSPHNHTFTGAQHNHPFTGTSQDFAVAYVDVIICAKA
jgi:hypothetical protein